MGLTKKEWKSFVASFEETTPMGGKTGGQINMAKYLGITRQAVTQFKAGLYNPRAKHSRPMPKFHLEALRKRMKEIEAAKGADNSATVS